MTYIYKPGTGPFPCTEDFPEEISVPANYIGECKEQRYLQAATFENPNERNTNYFMLVNRRCSPFINDNTTEDNNGGRRLVQIQFDPNASELANYNGWTITDIATNTQIRFNKVGMPVVDLGFFLPGEGKLYKMSPTIRSGGVLAGDEVITGESFTCEDTIFSNGYNITIGTGTNMKFTDSSCIVMNGGVFTMGDQQVSGPQNITFDAASGNSWRGHSFTGTEVHIYGASFTGIANDSVYALNMVDCPVVDIRNTRVL